MLAAPRTEIDIPLNRVTHVTTTRSHLSKSIFRPLLLVEFDTPEGPDSIAWALRDTDGWVKAVYTAWKNLRNITT
jgi:hypothetical protein